MKLKAYAKINLALDVVARREDGYHELDMIMAPISLYDEIEIVVASKDEVTCSDSNLKIDENNTVVQAVNLMREHFKLKTCFRVHIEKHIPMQAGLAGGSTDAAVILRAIDTLCELNQSEAVLLELGKRIGADVPFCLINEVSRVRGIGEKIERLPFSFDISFLLVKPTSGVSTKDAFEHIDFHSAIHPDIDGIIQKIKKNDQSFIQDLENTLEQSSFKLNRDIEKIVKKAEEFNFDKVLMSGSGSSVFMVSNDLNLLQNAQKMYSNDIAFSEIHYIKVKKTKKK